MTSFETSTPFAVFDHSPIGHFLIDGQLTICFWNRRLENWTGFSRESMVGNHLGEQYPHLIEPRYLNRIKGVLSGGPPTTFSSQLHNYVIPATLPSGRKRAQHTVVTGLNVDGDGELLALFSIQDVSSLTDAIGQHTEALHKLTREVKERQKEVQRRKEAEESLREVDHMKNDFIASAAHELNTPLATIQGYAELLLDADGDFSPAQKVDFVEEILESTQTLSKIIDDLLDITRFEKGRSLILNKAPVDIEKLLKNVVRHFKDHHAPQEVVLEGTVVDVAVEIDAMRIRQVLENILSNAVKYSPVESRITLCRENVPGGIQVTVTDEGVGMDEGQLSKVFDKFFRADLSNTAIRGLGLGMSIVKQIVELHGGQITIVSEPSCGTTVKLFLPCR